MADICEEFERHAAECRAMAVTAYDPQYRDILLRMARRLDELDQAIWLKHAFTAVYSAPPPHLFR